MLFGIGFCWAEVLSHSGALCCGDGPRHLTSRCVLIKLDVIKSPWKIWRRFITKNNLKTLCYRNLSCFFLVGVFLATNNLLNNLSWEQCKWAHPDTWVLEKAFGFGTFGRDLTLWFSLCFATAWNFALPDFLCFFAKITLKVLRRKRDMKYPFQYFLTLGLKSCYS